MRYLIGLFVPVFFQISVVMIIISMNQGNGSWAGVAAFLLGLFAIPLTAIINGLYIWKNPQVHILTLIAKCFTLAILAPLMCMVTFML